MNLTEHFTLEELVVTQHRNIDNTPSAEALTNLSYLATSLEEVRLMLNTPMTITSGYRCPDLNAAIGGSRNSRHMVGLAADFISPRYGTPLDVCLAIFTSTIDFDQLIYEHTWVHFGLCPYNEKPRREVLTFLGNNSYAKGLMGKFEKKKED